MSKGKKKGLWDNIHAKRERIKKQKARGTRVERMRSPGSEGAPTAEALERSKTTRKARRDQKKKATFE